MNKITFLRLQELLSYDADTGQFRWRADKLSCRGQIVAHRGAQAGGKNSIGYWQMVIDGRNYLGHRLVWLYVHGEWPTNQIDHINGNKSDNRIANLRPADYSDQRGNQKRRKDNSTGIKGVGIHKKSGLYTAICRKKGMPKYTAYFHSKEQAAKAYADASKRMFGEFARTE